MKDKEIKLLKEKLNEYEKNNVDKKMIIIYIIILILN